MTSEVNIPEPCSDCHWFKVGKGFKDCTCPNRDMKTGNCGCKYILPDNMGDGYE